MLGIVHQLAFGDLKLDQGRIDACRIDHGADAHIEVGLAELTRRYVHRHGNRPDAAGGPAFQVFAGASYDPFTDRHDEPGLFEHRNELRRRYDAPLGMLPA